MSELGLYQALMIFAWFPLAFTLAMLMLVARFYERFSGTRTYWPLFGLPLVGYAAAYVREAAIGIPADPLADVLQMLSGVVLAVLSARLALYMLRHRTAAHASLSPLLFALSGAIGAFGLAFALFMLSRFTRRMVRLNQQPAHHHMYYLATLGVLAVGAIRLLAQTFEPPVLLAYAGLLAASTTLSSVASWRSWSWLLAERA